MSVNAIKIRFVSFITLSLTIFFPCYAQEEMANILTKNTPLTSEQEYQQYFVELENHNQAPQITKSGLVFKDDGDLTELFFEHGVKVFKPVFLEAKNPSLNRTYGMELADNALIPILQKRYSKRFIMIEPVPIMYPLYTPSDYYSAVLPPTNTYWHLGLINATGAWSITRGNPNVVIGIVEPKGSFFDDTHTDLQGQFNFIEYQMSFAGTNSHGTAVAQLASGKTDDGVGLASIGFNTRLSGLTFKSFASAWYDYGRMLRLAIRGTRIINMSFYLGNSNGTPINSVTSENLMLEMYNLGAILVGSAGNDFQTYHYPASSDHVISVTSIGSDETHVNALDNTTHTHNDKVDLSAPGYSIPIALNGNNYASWGTGSSFAAPMVSGTVALMLSANACLSPDDVETILKTTAKPIDHYPGNQPYQGLIGAGLVDAYAAVGMAQNFTSTNYVPPVLQSDFTYETYCDDNLDERLRVTGLDNPLATHHQFNLHDQTSNQIFDLLNPSGAHDVGPHSFSHILVPGKNYYVKRGVWDQCQSWQETRHYNISTTSCIEQQNYEITPLYVNSAIEGFSITGNTYSGINNVHYTVYTYASSPPSYYIHANGAPYHFPVSPMIRPHKVEAIINFSNGKTKTLIWM